MAIAGVAAGPWGRTVRAQSANSFPGHAVKLLTPASAGSGPDAAIRTVAEGLARQWSQPVVVENRPGGNGFIATSGFKNAKADGHELIVPDIAHICTYPATFRKLPYDPQKDFEPIRPILLTQFYVAVATDSPFRTLDDIIRKARENPGKVTYGSWHVGSPGHLGALRLESLTGTHMSHVPYKEMPQLFQGVANGEVDWAFGSVASAGPQERAGKIRFIAVGGPKRSGMYPDVPTVDESAGVKGFENEAWFGFFAPKGTPKAVKEQISDDVRTAMQTPAMKERYKGFGYELIDLGPDAFGERIRRETAAWKQVIEQSGLKLD